MKLIVHPGLHKTGSTYLQHVLNDNQAVLAASGLYYEPQVGYPAHHHAAWRILQGDGEPLALMIAAARDIGCHTVLLSSEDLEGALHDDRPIAAIERAAAEGGIEQVEWHVVLRDPGECFASLFAQLQHHVYADALSLFHDAMRRGFVSIAEPMPGEGTPYWYYSFDHGRDLERLSRRISGQVIAHDFQDRSPFPGYGILQQAGVLDAIRALPGSHARNARPERDDIITGYVRRIAEVVPDEGDQATITEGFLTCLESGLAQLPTYSEIIGRTYGESHRAALQRFGASLPGAGEQPAEEIVLRA